MQHTLALVDMEANSVLIYSNTNHFIGPTACTEGYGGHYMVIWKAQVILGIGHLPHACMMFMLVLPVAENILGVDILTSAQLNGTQGKFQLQICMVKTPRPPTPCATHSPKGSWVVHIKQYRQLGDRGNGTDCLEIGKSRGDTSCTAPFQLCRMASAEAR